MLKPLPEKPKKVVIGTSVRKPLAVLEAYLKTLAWQVVPPGIETTYVFVPDFTPEQSEADQYLRAWVAERHGVVLRAGAGRADDFSDAPGQTHIWTGSAMGRVAENKNRIIRHSRELGADAVWFCDSDLLCDPYTLQSLWSCDVPVACGVYWTRWHKGTPEQKIHAAPQVWLNHPYIIHGRGWEEHEFRKALIDRQLTQVWGQGACSLIRKEVFERGVDFSFLPDLPKDGMWQGEDRHFCVKCERAHIPMYADPWPDIFHVYHQPEDVALIPEMLATLSRTTPPWKPHIGGLVSLTLEAMEPVPQRDHFAHVPPQKVRGRLGRLDLVPEIEDAVLGMGVGDQRILPVHFDISHPLPFFRGRRRLIRVTLHDAKPYDFAPVVRDELFISPRGGRPLDHVHLSQEQHDGIQELATQ